RRFALQRPGHEVWAVVPLVNHEDVAGHVLGDHVPGLFAEAAAATDLQALALAERVVEHARVAAPHLARRRPDLARPGRQVAGQEAAEIALADEADAGGVLLGRGRQAGRGGHRAHRVLFQPAQGEDRRRELFLPQLVQEIALVLATVRGAQQPPGAPGALHARVVA